MKKLLVLLLSILMLCSCGQAENSIVDGYINRASDLKGKKIGVVNDTNYEAAINKAIEKCTINYFDNQTDALTALSNGEIDAYVTNKYKINAANVLSPSLIYINDTLGIESFAYCINEDKLLMEFDAYIERLKENGELKKLLKKWSGRSVDDVSYTPHMLIDKNGTIKAATSKQDNCFVFKNNGEYAGFDIELINSFCYEYGYDLTIDEVNPEEIESLVTKGEYNIGFNAISDLDQSYSKQHLTASAFTSDIVAVVRRDDAVKTNAIKNLSDLNGNDLGCMSGSIFDQTIEKNFEESSISYFNSRAELIEGIRTGKIQGYLSDEPVAMMVVADNDDITYIDESLGSIEYGVIFNKNNTKLLDEFNVFLNEIIANKEINRLQEKWMSKTGANQEIGNYTLTGENGTINAITTPDAAPFSFYRNNKWNGFDTELVYMFCEKNGYDLQIDSGSFDALISGVSSGKYDLSFNGIFATDERKKSVNFSIPTYESDSVAIIRKPDANYGGNLVEISDINGYDVGAISGIFYSDSIKEKLPNSEVLNYDTISDAYNALSKGEIAAYFIDYPIANSYVKNDDRIMAIDMPMYEVESNGIAFNKDKAEIKNQFNDFLRRLSITGLLNTLKDKWINEDKNIPSVDKYNLTGENGTIKALVCPEYIPLVFNNGGEYGGFEYELVMMFCEEYGYDLEVTEGDFVDLVPKVASGEYDISFAALTITEDRLQYVDFSDVIYTTTVVAVVRKAKDNGILSTIKEKVYRTFVEEDRYLLIYDGILTTLLITFSSIVFGTLLGFIAFLISRYASKIVIKIFDGFAYIISGLPAVIILMVLFYIIFVDSAMSGTVISIIGFGTMFACTTYSLLKVGVSAIDEGQMEGALALGYSKLKALFKFVMPQALRIVMPSYSGEIISLIKSTSIVGYVTVQDLTRASDIIRSRTYDAFFPLIMTAVIYFMIAYVITKLAKELQKKFLPHEKSTKEILRNVKN